MACWEMRVTRRLSKLQLFTKRGRSKKHESKGPGRNSSWLLPVQTASSLDLTTQSGAQELSSATSPKQLHWALGSISGRGWKQHTQAWPRYIEKDLKPSALSR